MGGGSSPGSSSGQPKPGEGKPQGGQTADNRQEQGDRQPGEQPGGEKPEQQGEGDKTADGEKPNEGGENPDPSEMRPANQTPDQATQSARPVAAGAEDWGNLPQHVRELFRAEGGRDVPPRYRDWIDSYYRRLNRRSGGN